MKRDIAFVNGQVITLESERPRAEAILIRGGRVAAVGDTREILSQAGTRAEIVELDGRAALPGFVDSHMHPSLYGTILMEMDCSPPAVKSISDILETIALRVKKEAPDTWIRGWGYNDSELRERRHPTRWDLDTVAKDNPVLISRGCGHLVVVNSKALELAGITKDTPDPKGGQIHRDPSTGEPTGLLMEHAQELIPVPPYSKQEMEHGLGLALGDCVRWGLTTVHDAEVHRVAFSAYQNLASRSSLSARARLWLVAKTAWGWEGLLESAVGLGLKSGFGDEMLKVMGMKFVIDGGFGGRTAAVTEGYVGEPENKGLLLMDEDELSNGVARCLENGLRVAIHAIGDRAIETAIRSMERAARKLPKETVRAMRNRIEHCTMPTENQLHRMRDLGIVASSSIGFLYPSGDTYRENLGESRAAGVFPHRRFIDMGIAAPGNSDCPVVSANPLLGIYGAVTRKTRSGHVLGQGQALSIEEALQAYSSLGAYGAVEEQLYGTLKPGKYGDIVVLSGDPGELGSEAIKDLKVEMTLVNGVTVYQS